MVSLGADEPVEAAAEALILIVADRSASRPPGGTHVRSVTPASRCLCRLAVLAGGPVVRKAWATPSGEGLHPSAAAVAVVLDEMVAGAEVRQLESSTRSAAESAATLGCEAGAIASSLVFMADDGPVLNQRSPSGGPRSGGRRGRSDRPAQRHRGRSAGGYRSGDRRHRPGWPSCSSANLGRPGPRPLPEAVGRRGNASCGLSHHFRAAGGHHRRHVLRVSSDRQA